MNGTTLTTAQFGLLAGTVLECLPEGVTLDTLNSWRLNKEETRKNMAFLAQMAPEPKRRRKSPKTFDEAAYFKTRLGLWVDGDLGRYVGLKVRSTRSHSVLKRRALSEDESEATMFGKSGSDQYTNTLATAVDLGQIGGKIDKQWNGEEGELLTDGRANIFPVIGLDGALHVVHVYRHDGRWRVHCYPFYPDNVWYAGRQVFSN